MARALQLWLGGRLAVIARRELFLKRTTDHVVLSLSAFSAGVPLYLDADGVTTALPLLKCWNLRERLGCTVLEDPADHACFESLIKNEFWSARLAEQFEGRFGVPQRSDLAGLLGRMD